MESSWILFTEIEEDLKKAGIPLYRVDYAKKVVHLDVLVGWNMFTKAKMVYNRSF